MLCAPVTFFRLHHIRMSMGSAFRLRTLEHETFPPLCGKGYEGRFALPLKSNTVPVWAVPQSFYLLLSSSVYTSKHDLHNALLGLLFSVLIAAVLTDAIKDAVGRPRPDFFWRCFPDGKEMDAADFNDMASRSGQFSVASSEYDAT
ncbi:hypothetical protein KSP40_PGU002386 [Platanthera guangdongensis]|uniref:Phosphatidic acid phosphatase type 2/haloperoxidase domain-containing protein n=1 Tax=Platanthera guangdongensis TaxID=2320717 RepID=A0ABR2MTQ9_9ASPA